VFGRTLLLFSSFVPSPFRDDPLYPSEVQGAGPLHLRFVQQDRFPPPPLFSLESFRLLGGEPPATIIAFCPRLSECRYCGSSLPLPGLNPSMIVLLFLGDATPTPQYGTKAVKSKPSLPLSSPSFRVQGATFFPPPPSEEFCYLVL